MEIDLQHSARAQELRTARIGTLGMWFDVPSFVIKLKRAYEPSTKDDGYRILVDRLWPRGVKKSDLPFDEWAKELAPSAELRKSFGHESARWKEFRARYQFELRALLPRAKLSRIAKKARRSTVTLVYSARDEEHNNAVVLKAVLERITKRSGTSRKVA